MTRALDVTCVGELIAVSGLREGLIDFSVKPLDEWEIFELWVSVDNVHKKSICRTYQLQ